VSPFALYGPPVRSNGLLGSYFANDAWSGTPAFAQIDPNLTMYFHVPTLTRPYTVIWRGKLAIPEDGTYEFALQSIDESELLIDGQSVAAARVGNEQVRGGATLVAGLHELEVRYADRTNHTFINLLWMPPGVSEAFRPIPTELLFPPQENYDSVVVADLAHFLQAGPEVAPVVVRERIDPAQVEIFATGLAEPRGVAVVDGLVYVAEAGARRIVAIDPASGRLSAVDLGDEALEEPFDLAHVAGQLVIQDAGSGDLLVFQPLEGTTARVPVDGSYVARSRGIGAGNEGTIWLANTPGQRVAQIDGSGRVLRDVTLPAVATDGREMQPVDVVALADDSIYVTDVANHMLYHFSLAGYLLASQAIPVANALDSSHLAVDDLGRFYLTEPETGRVVRLNAAGTVERAWTVRTPVTPDAKPVGIDVDATGAIWVADSLGGRVLRIVPEEE
jgi:streptogramin lyase